MMKKPTFFHLLFTLVPLLGFAGDPNLTLDRIFSDRDFDADRFGPARWLDGGDAFTTVEPSTSLEGGKDLVRYQTRTGKREILLPAEKLVFEPDAKPADIADYTFSPDGKHLLLFTNTQRVWRRNTRGDYHVITLGSWERAQLGGDAEPSTLMFAKFSPQGGKVAYVRANNLYVEDLQTHAIRQLTKDGSTTIINGTFDWAYEEEFGLRDGFRWSPDGKSIAYWQLDAEGVGVFHMINNTDSLYPKIIPVQYPKAGTTNSACRAGVVDVNSAKTRWFQIEGDSRNYYLARMEWAGDSKEVVIQHLNRYQNTLSLLLGNAATGKVKSLFTETDKAWLDVVDDVLWYEQGKSFTWVSDRDGWNRAYTFARDGKMQRGLTPESGDVTRVVSISAETGWLYYTASPENPTQNYLYRARLDGTGEPHRLTPADQPGSHRYDISPNQEWAFHTYSRFGVPAVTELVRLPDHGLQRVLVDNAELKDKVAALNRGEGGLFRVEIEEGVELDGWLLKPPDFDPGQKYPILFFVYGEPAGTTVRDAWLGDRYLWHLMLSQQGYLVASVDNRGTPAPRGRQWRKCVYGPIGSLSSSDQAAAAKKIGAWDFVDANRIAIWGWSGGGSSTLNAMFRYPKVYKTGMSVAPVPDQRLYDTIYQERYQGLPDKNAENYKLGSPITYADQLEGNLLIVHGTGDDNVHYQGTQRLINKLVEEGKHFTMMSYPNRSHGIHEGEGTTRHLYGLLTRYLHENL